MITIIPPQTIINLFDKTPTTIPTTIATQTICMTKIECIREITCHRQLACKVATIATTTITIETMVLLITMTKPGCQTPRIAQTLIGMVSYKNQSNFMCFHRVIECSMTMRTPYMFSSPKKTPKNCLYFKLK